MYVPHCDLEFQEGTAYHSSGTRVAGSNLIQGMDYVRVILPKEVGHSLVQRALPYVYKLEEHSRTHRLHRPMALFNIT